jgi:hypothetical protein
VFEESGLVAGERPEEFIRIAGVGEVAFSAPRDEDFEARLRIPLQQQDHCPELQCAPGGHDACGPGSDDHDRVLVSYHTMIIHNGFMNSKKSIV